jgi:hypothetical protein
MTLANVVRLPVDRKPEELLDWSEKLTPPCENYRRSAPKVVRHNGYPTASASFMCDRIRQGGQGGVGVIHVIVRNPGSAGITQRLARVPAFDIANPPPEAYQKEQELMRWIDGLIFCDRRDPKHPCPPGG